MTNARVDAQSMSAVFQCRLLQDLSEMQHDVVIHSVSGARRREVTNDVTAAKCEVANAIKQLVPGTFVVGSNCVANNAVSTKDEQVTGRRTFAVSLCFQSLDFGFKDERPSEGDLRSKRLWRDLKRRRLNRNR